MVALSIASAELGLSVSTPIASGGRLEADANIVAVCLSCALCGSKLYWVNWPTCGTSPVEESRGRMSIWSSMSRQRGIGLPSSSENISSLAPRMLRGGTE